MSEWTMPEWMREVLQAIDDRDIPHIEETMNEPMEPWGRSAIHLFVSQSVKRLEALRTAGLLLTPGEDKERDITLSEIGVAMRGDATLITRLRAENEKMRGLLERAGDKLCRQDMYEELQKEIWQALGADHE